LRPAALHVVVHLLLTLLGLAMYGLMV